MSNSPLDPVSPRPAEMLTTTPGYLAHRHAMRAAVLRVFHDGVPVE